MCTNRDEMTSLLDEKPPKSCNFQIDPVGKLSMLEKDITLRDLNM